MIRSPYTAVSDAWSTSGILTRAREADGFTDASPFGYDAEYFPAELINTPATPSALFTDDAPRTGGIFAHFVLSKLDSSFLEDCDIPSIISGVYDPHGWKDFDGGGDLFIGAGRLVSTIGPTFFAEPDSGTTIIDSPAAVGRVARTGNFPAIEGGVTVMWGAQRNDALIDMLDLAPYDSLLDDSADVLIRLELVRASDDSVLWQSDPVSARTLSTEPVGYATEIAADSLAGTDTMVYARLSVYVSPEVDMEVSTGYQFIDKPDTYFPRRVRHAVDAEGNTIDLTLTAVPNPARSSDVRITLQSETVPDGAASLTLYDARGAEVADLGALTIREGVGSGLLRVDQLRAGVYVLVARVRQRIASARVTVVR